MHRLPLLLSFLVPFFAPAQQVQVTKNIQEALNRIDTTTIRSHIAYLADDKLKGRLPGTEGYQMAVDYVTGQLKQIGVTPGGDNGAYTQKLVIRKAVLNNSSASAILKNTDGKTDTLSFLKDFTPIAHPLKTSSSATAALIFAGYGVDIPGGYSDYTGIDVKGKIVVLVVGAPDGLSSTITAHFSNAGNKMNTAFAKGAVGAIIIEPATRQGTNPNPNPVVQHNVALNPAKTAAYGRRFIGNLQVVLNSNKNLLSRLFAATGKDVDAVLSNIKSGKPSSFALPFTLSTSYTTTHTDFESSGAITVGISVLTSATIEDFGTVGLAAK